MKSKNLSELSVEELLKQQKTTKFATGVPAGMLTVLLIMGILLTIQDKRFSAIVIVPFGLLPIVVLSINSLKEIKRELLSRESVK